MLKTKLHLSQKAQGKLSSFHSSTNDGLTNPEKRCYKEMTSSIMTSGHIHLRKLAAHTQDNMSKKNICKRFRRHLSKVDFGDKIAQNCLSSQCGKIKKDTIICVDTSDIIKKEATKMEGLKFVRDGSKDCQSLGYDTLNIIAFDLNKQGIIPLSSDFFSGLMEIDSLKDKLYDRINDIQYFTQNKGIFVYDRGFDDRKFIHYLTRNTARFAIRSMMNRLFYIQFEGDTEIKSYKFEDILQKKLPDNPKFKGCVINCYICIDPHPRKHPNLIPIKLVIARYVKAKSAHFEKGGYFAFICNFEEENISEEQLVSKMMKIYRIRWKIEEVHRHVKQTYKWEDISLMTYDRLKNMNIILWAAICFLYSMDSLIEEIKIIFRQLFSDRAYKKRKGFFFIYYRLSLVAKELFDVVDRRWIYRYGGRHYERQQMVIKFI